MNIPLCVWEEPRLYEYDHCEYGRRLSFMNLTTLSVRVEPHLPSLVFIFVFTYIVTKAMQNSVLYTNTPIQKLISLSLVNFTVYATLCRTKRNHKI